MSNFLQVDPMSVLVREVPASIQCVGGGLQGYRLAKVDWCCPV